MGAGVTNARSENSRAGGTVRAAARYGPLLVGALLLAGCQMPDFRGMVPAPRSAAPATADPAPDPATDPLGEGAGIAAPAPSASVAEAACMQAGRDRDLTVREIVGTREVPGADGIPASRDVMLRVARGQQVYDVRCSYSYASAQARIMSL